MGKIWVEVCLVSARGLRHSSSFWKLQWYAVGWIDPNNRYCTKIDASGNSNPTWRTKFATVVDDSMSNFHELELQVEVYSREPVFLRERLQGTATIVLKEFLAKLNHKRSKIGTPEFCSYQLRKGNSSKPRGFIDVSIHISEEKTEPSSSSTANGGGVLLRDGSNQISLATEDGSAQAYPAPLPFGMPHKPENQSQSYSPYAHEIPFPPNYSDPSSGGGPSYHLNKPRTPPPPPPPSNVGYLPTFLPRMHHLQESSNYFNMPPNGAAIGHGKGPAFAAGVGAGALAAGAVVFGDDFMSGFETIPTDTNF